MSRSIEVPDDLYASLAAYARERGQTAEDVLLAVATELVRQHRQDKRGQPRRGQPRRGPKADPVAPFIGAFTFGIGDLAEHHDRYLADAYADSHEREE